MTKPAGASQTCAKFKGSEIPILRRSTLVGKTIAQSLTIEEPVIAPTWDATLSPDPATVDFTSDEVWYSFTVTSGGTVDVVVNPTGAKRLEIYASNHRTLCPGETGDTVSRNNGATIYLSGCLVGSGTVELRREIDDSLIRTYYVTVSAPAAPPPTWDATLYPDPSSARFMDDGSWHSFAVRSGGEVEVVVNPPGTVARLEISTSGIGNLCPADDDDDRTLDNGETVYISGCVTGSATIQLRRTADDSLARTYYATVRASPPTVCNPLRSFNADRRSGTSVRVSWSNPSSGGMASTGRQVYIHKWVNNDWQFERTIDEQSHRNYSWHVGLDSGSWYSYRGKNVCGSTSSTWSSWETVTPWLGRSDGGAGGSEGPPEPTPEGPAGAGRSDEDVEQPPTPRGQD